MTKSITAGVHSAPAQIFSSLLSSIIPSRFFAVALIQAALVALPSGVWSASFGSGNIVVYRVTSGSTLANSATAAYLDEYTTSGTFVQTIALPSTGATTGNRALNCSGSATSEGQITLSPDGQYITCVGYNANVGTASVVSTSNNGGTSDVSRVVGRVDFSGNVDSSTALVGTSASPMFTANNIRCAVFNSGSFYVAGAAAPFVGVASFGGNTATSVVGSGSIRNVNIFGGDLYYCISSTISKISGLPATASAGTAIITGLTSAYGFAFLDVGNTGAVNTCYVTDGTSLKKFALSSGSWVAKGSATTTTGLGLAAKVSGSNVILFVSSAGKIETITDSSGSAGTLSGTATALTLSGGPALSGSSALRGIAFAPIIPAGPSITGATTATAFTTTYGAASAAQSFSISGSNLTANLVATAPTGFEVSSDGITYDTTATFTQSGRSASGSLRVRLKANAAVSGSYNAQNVVLSSTGATSVNIFTASTGNAVTAKGLTITANDQAVNAGSALANVPASSNFTSSGLANGEEIGTVSLNYGGAGAVAGTFPIVPSGATGGTFTASNYSISYVNGTLTVSSAPVPAITLGTEVPSPLNTIYGTPSGETSFTVSADNLNGPITVTPPAGFEISQTSGTGFASSLLIGGSGPLSSTTLYVRLSDAVPAGSYSGNVSFSTPGVGGSGTVSQVYPLAGSTVLKKDVSITGVTANNKIYDKGTVGTISGTPVASGILARDTANVSVVGTPAVSFADPNVGTGITVNVSGYSLSGSAAGNYNILPLSLVADITQADQTITFAALSPVSVGASFTLSATASSGLAVTYVSSDSNVATISGNTVTSVGPGTCDITASQAGDGNYKAATDVVRSLVVNAPRSVDFNGNTYTQNFDSMTSGTANSVALSASTMTEVSSLTGGGSVNGWYIYATGWSTGPATSKWVAGDTGGSNAGGFREMIDSGTSIGRALGSQGSGSAVGFFGVVLKNTSGRTIDKVDISYDAVMNRNPSTTANNYPMSYMVSSASISGTAGSTGPGTFNKSAGTWVDGVGFSTPTTGTGAPNATQAAITPLFKIGGASITQKLIGLNWPANGYLYIRWSETDEGGSDATAGVDNFTISAVSPAPTISSISPTSVLRGSGNTPVTFTGTGYSSPETTVSISGSALSLTNVSSNSLTANVTSNYFTTAGTLTMTLSNPTPGGGSVSTNLAVVTPRPTILGLSPASVVAGTGDTLLTISGTGFFPDSVVRWNGTDLTTSYNSPTQLTTTIPAANLASMAVASVTVATPDLGGLFQESLISIFQVTSPTVPQVTPSVGTLSGFETPVGTPSAEQSYLLQGQYLASNVLVTAPAQFQISKTSGSGFGSSLDLTAGEVGAGVTIFVRYNPSVASSSHLGSISHVSVGAVTQFVAVTGNSQPTISADPAALLFTDFRYVAGDNSGIYGETPSILVNGARLAAPITVTAPKDYGVSTDGVSFTATVTLLPDPVGVVSAVPVMVRFQPLSAVAADENVIISSGSLNTVVSANGRATALIDDKYLSDQARDGRVTLSWACSGSGMKTIVLAKLGSSITDVPSDIGSLTASSVYGQGSQVGSSYLVYKEDQGGGELNATEKVTITGLTNGQQYAFKVIVVNNDALSAGTSVKSIPFADFSNVLTQWTFNSNPADAQTATGTLSPSTGTGTANAIGLVTTPAYLGGSMTDPLGSAGAATGGDNSSLSYAGPTSGTVPNKSAGVVIAVSTVGRKDIVIYWDNRHSNSGPKHLLAQYTLDVTAASPVWVDYVAATDGLNVANGGLYEAQAGDTWYIRRKADLTGVTGVADNAKFGFRLVASYAPGESGYRKADGTSTSALAYFAGNFRTDMLTVTGTPTAQTPFESWATGYGLSGASAAGTADPDNDGMDNNAEFAFGTSPIAAGSRAAILTTETGKIKLTWFQRAGVSYAVKSFTDLATPFNSGAPVTAAQSADQNNKPSADYTRWEAVLNTDGDKGFVRVRAQQ